MQTLNVYFYGAVECRRSSPAGYIAFWWVIESLNFV